jgi:hypothetical protein
MSQTNNLAYHARPGNYDVIIYIDDMDIDDRDINIRGSNVMKLENETIGHSIPMDVHYNEMSKKTIKRCKYNDCRNKIKLNHYACACGFTFCPIHRDSWKHSCTVDYMMIERERLRKQFNDEGKVNQNNWNYKQGGDYMAC